MVILLTVALCLVVIGAVVWAIRLDLRDHPDRFAWLCEWSDHIQRLVKGGRS